MNTAALFRTLPALTRFAPAAATPADAVFLPALARLGDGALLAHYRAPRTAWFEPVVDAEETRADRIEALLGGEFQFNGERHRLSDPINWLVNPSVDHQWQIQLHRFHYAVGLGLAWKRTGDTRYVRRWRQLLAGWMDGTPAGFIAAEVTGRRVQNWICSLHSFVLQDGGAPLDGAFLRRLLHALHEQVQYLCANLTAQGSPRTLELAAIMLAGVAFPEMAQAAHWREFALAQTAANLQADLLPDGVHVDLSTDRHHLALRHWLQVRALARRNGLTLPPGMDDALQRGFEFSLHVHQPQGLVPSFSDGDIHSYLPLLAQAAELYGRDDMQFVATRGVQGAAPGARLVQFPHGGYHVLRSAWEPAPRFGSAQHLVFDCGPLGAGKHAHFDALSFELAAHGRALVVDPGRYTHSEAGDVNWPVYFRSTAAHNTVCVDGRTQTRPAAAPSPQDPRHGHGQPHPHGCGPAPATTLLEAATSPRLDLLHGRAVSAEYDVVHERVIVFVDQRYWVLSDSLRSPSRHDYAMRLQLSAAAQGVTTLAGVERPVLHSPGLCVAVAAAPGQPCEVEAGWVSARYGHKDSAPRLCNRASGADVDFDAVLLPWQDHAPRLAVTRLPVPGAPHALRITVDGTGCIDTWFHSRSKAAHDVVVAGVSFTGRWLLLRHATNGALLHATSHAGAEVRAGAVPVTLIGDTLARP